MSLAKDIADTPIYIGVIFVKKTSIKILNYDEITHIFASLRCNYLTIK
jgi:hypothetical protein